MKKLEELKAHAEYCLKHTLMVTETPALILALIKAVEALEFYADKENNWDYEEMTPTCWDNGDIDLGNRARQALEAIEKDMG